jgi:hypothetical protein
LDFAILEQVIAHRSSVIAVETKSLDDTNAIFESLNAKGKPLSQLDLLVERHRANNPGAELQVVGARSHASHVGEVPPSKRSTSPPALLGSDGLRTRC